jgi:phosphoglycerol transferase MdoB-like AlkP superfamily enzyme
LINQPKQLFLIVMESYDSWPLQDKYRSFGMSKNLSEIADNGIYFNNFLPSSESTMNSIASIITGIPYSGVSQSQIGAINLRYCSSIFDQFKKLGYQTNFFYGGLLSWGNISNLFENQGVENQYSAVDMGGKTESGIWGIEDEKLFELVTKTVDNQNSSFNIILTTSYHPPYSINLKEKGFPYHNISEIPVEMLNHYDGSMNLKELGHLWYSDKCIGDFVKNAQQKFPNALFCFTGDHYGRRFINSKPNLKEKSLVPFIIYGSSIKDSICNTPGSHIDIFPTLVEMISPKGFNYYSFGESLFNTKNIGIGKIRSITKKSLEYYPKSSKITSFNLFNNNTSKLDSSSNLIEYKKLNSLGWHYTIKGDSIYSR